MNSRIRSLFSGSERRSSASTAPTSPTSSRGLNGNYVLLGRPYNQAVASDAPIHGVYPLSPNGLPNRDRASTPTTPTEDGAMPPSVPRYRGETLSSRPQTAPDNRPKKTGKSILKNNAYERTRPGFSVKSPLNSPVTKRTSSTLPLSRYKNEEPSSMPVSSRPPIASMFTSINTSVPSQAVKSHKTVSAYRPSHGPASSATYANFTSPLSQQTPRQLNTRAAYVDLLEAYSNINQSHDISKRRVKASGVRNYGEDVADRNIAEANKSKLMTPRIEDRGSSRLDTNNLEFKYLRSGYSKSKVRGTIESHSGVASALGHKLLGSDDDLGGETRQTFTSSHGSHIQHSSLGSFTGSRPGTVFPLQIDSAASRRQLPSIPSSSSLDYASDENYGQRSRTRSPGPTDGQPRQELVSSTRVGHTPAIAMRGRQQYQSPNTARQPIIPTSNFSRKPPTVAGIVPPKSSHSTQASMSSIANTAIHRKASPSKGKNYSTLPNTNHAQDGEAAQSPISHPKPMIIEGENEAPSLEGVVDLTDTVDTNISTKTLPAVVQENVTPTPHEIRDEHITREIHNHDVYHRVLPVIQTEILPTKHYVLAKDGKSLIEIPESMIPGRSANGSPHRNWEIIETPHGAEHGSILHRTSTEVFDGPVDRARLEATPELKPESPTSSTTTGVSLPNEPMLASKLESLTKDGISRTEYTWRHPPVYEVNGQATKKLAPLYVGAGIGDISAPQESEDDDQTSESAFVRTPVKEEEDLLFRDSGYGSGGMLPGLQEKGTSSPTHIFPRLRKAFTRGGEC
ncbi:hypothetical protein B7494_g4881 [Chlorociboria aeruginascens]|nr:hypothetical protein B7494_g4881 [Chlorociboria aeruginascens]